MVLQRVVVALCVVLVVAGCSTPHIPSPPQHLPAASLPARIPLADGTGVPRERAPRWELVADRHPARVWRRGYAIRGIDGTSVTYSRTGCTLTLTERRVHLPFWTGDDLEPTTDVAGSGTPKAVAARPAAAPGTPTTLVEFVRTESRTSLGRAEARLTRVLGATSTMLGASVRCSDRASLRRAERSLDGDLLVVFDAR